MDEREIMEEETSVRSHQHLESDFSCGDSEFGWHTVRAVRQRLGDCNHGDELVDAAQRRVRFGAWEARRPRRVQRCEKLLLKTK